jgi:hypothetical protein
MINTIAQAVQQNQMRFLNARSASRRGAQMDVVLS